METTSRTNLRNNLLRRVRLVLLLVLTGGAVATLLFFATLPDVTPLATAFPETTAFMERRKRQLAQEGKPASLDWRPVPLSRISPFLVRAVVVAEDARFWKHGGVDWEAVREVLGRDLEEGELRHGASTITPQLAKNLYLSPSRTPWRKLREWAIARRLEKTLPKKRILELYLNVIEFGPRTYGAEAAARRYFGKPATLLSRMEAATLAAIIPSPRVYDPKLYPGRVARRARRILRGMGGGARPRRSATPPARVLTTTPAAEPTTPFVPAMDATPPSLTPTPDSSVLSSESYHAEK